MVDYKKIRKIVLNTTVALAASAALWVGMQQWQKASFQKAFEKLPKDQQEIVIKLRKDKTPEKTIRVNIKAYNQLIDITNRYKEILDNEERIDTLKLTDRQERDLKYMGKTRDNHLLLYLIIEAKNLEQQLTIFDKTETKELIASMEILKAQIKIDIENLEKLIRK